MSAAEEEWRWVVGYEGDYEVSSLGRVRSWKRSATPRLRSTKTKAGGQRTLGQGYPTVSLRRDGVMRNLYVHRLVLEAFVGPRPDGAVTRHLDGDSTNNALTNLRYGTQKENLSDQFVHGTYWTQRRKACRSGHPLVRRADGSALPCEPCAEARRERDRAYRRARRQRLKEASSEVGSWP